MSSASERRLVAILCADVAGYSRLIAEDEDATVQALRDARERVSALIPEHRGRLADFTGDNFLAEFAAARDAVFCALAIQSAMDEMCAALPEPRRLRFRVGAHLGDVRNEGGRLYGDGVNIAARLQALAAPGGVMASESVRLAIGSRALFDFEPAGEHALKNITEPVRAYRVRAVKSDAPSAAIPAAPQSPPELALPDKPSIAVLAFENLSGDPEQEYFTDGVTEDIITELSRFHSLFVIARNSSFTYKGKATDVRTIARELGVRYVVEGSIRRAGSRVRVSAQLIDALAGTHVWAERYDRELADIFEVQEEVTRSIVGAVGWEIEGAEVARATRRAPGSLTAYETAMRAYDRVHQAYIKQDSALREQGTREARQALAIDSQSVLALLTLAWALFQDAVFGKRTDSESASQEALSFATRAIELDRSNHLGFVYRALAFCVRGCWEEALTDARHALSLNPNDSFSLRTLGYVEMFYGNHEQAITHLLESLRMSPRDPHAHASHVHLAGANFFKKDYAKGLEWSLLTSREAPSLPAAHLWAAVCNVGLGDIGEAKAALSKERLIAPEFVEAWLRGEYRRRRPEDEQLQLVFLRIADGLEDPSAADALR
jgi:adenylate cyclase